MRTTSLLAILFALFTLQSHASGVRETRLPTNAKWASECASCHIAYPARMLPAASWRSLMSGLDKHFGTDASLDPATTAEILGFLEKNASLRKTAATTPPPLRITEMQWFIHEHDEISNRTWKDPRVKSPSNCAACHTGAEEGRFSEHALHVPK